MPALDEIQWTDPPARGGGPGPNPVYPALLAQVKARPHQWAMVGTGGTTSVRKAARAQSDGGRFEIATRTVEDNGSGPTRCVWVRWLPEA